LQSCAFWDQDSFTNTITNGIKLKTKLKEAFLFSGNKRLSLQNVLSFNNLLKMPVVSVALGEQIMG
jgi:hypothetical protein